MLHTDRQVLVKGNPVESLEVVGSNQVEYALEVTVDDQSVGPSVALGTLPSLVLVIRSYVAVDVEALEVGAEVAPGWDPNRSVSNGTLQLNEDLLCRLGLDFL